jgi:hypothetical protein
MKTRGITYACASAILSILMLINFSKSSAQVNFAFQRNASLGAVDNSFASGLMGDYAFEKKPVRNEPLISATLFSSFASTDNNKIAGTVNIDNRDSRKNAAGAENSYKTVAGNLGIRFRPTRFIYPQGGLIETGIAKYSATQVLYYAKALKQYAKEKGFDTTYAFLSNMGMLSSKKRLFVVNLVTMQIEQAGLVSHGRGQGKSKYDRQYSNIVESKCTSLGRYMIMKKYKGSYGESYRMTGLDSTNSNAFKRNIVLHSMGCIPDEENNAPVCISEGCPAVSNNFLSSLSRIIDSRKKPVLLWVFDSNLEEVVIDEMKPENSNEETPGHHKFHICSIHLRDNTDLQ